nr:PIN domain-containing protein [Halorussus ruber]
MSRRLFLDTNVFIASITKESERVEVAKKLLNSDYEFYTSLLNLLELRTVLAKKKRLERGQVEKAIERISEEVEIICPRNV